MNRLSLSMHFHMVPLHSIACHCLDTSLRVIRPCEFPVPSILALAIRPRACYAVARMGTLYYGDNLDILRRYLDDESVDLVYLDPPFNSAQNYNAFFQEKDGTAAAAQIAAFEDTWEWNVETEKTYGELIVQPGKVSEVMQAFMTFLGRNDMMAYLAMMAPRLVELRRVLKKTGSLSKYDL